MGIAIELGIRPPAAAYMATTSELSHDVIKQKIKQVGLPEEKIVVNPLRYALLLLDPRPNAGFSGSVRGRVLCKSVALFAVASAAAAIFLMVTYSQLSRGAMIGYSALTSAGIAVIAGIACRQIALNKEVARVAIDDFYLKNKGAIENLQKALFAQKLNPAANEIIKKSIETARTAAKEHVVDVDTRFINPLIDELWDPTKGRDSLINGMDIPKADINEANRLSAILRRKVSGGSEIANQTRAFFELIELCDRSPAILGMSGISQAIMDFNIPRR